MFRNAYNNRLYIGDAVSARDLSLVYEHRIEVVLDLAVNELPAQLGRDIIHCRFPLSDDDANDDRVVSAAIECLRDLIRHDFRTLVACSAGMSRSPTIAAAALSLHLKEPLSESLVRILGDAPRDVSPSLWAVVGRVHSILAGGPPPR